MDYDVFISYSHVDDAFVKKLGQALDTIGIQFFQDVKDIDWGVGIPEKVREGLDTSRAIIVVLSPASVKSQWVPFEIGHAMAAGKAVLPLLVHPSIELPGYIRNIKCITTIKEAVAFFQTPAWAVLRATSPPARNMRGIALDAAARQAGLVDIENRQNDRNLLPPKEFYESARSEIAMLALTAFRTFDMDIGHVRQALDSGKRVRVLILRPDSPAIPGLTKLHEGLNIQSQIEDVIGKIHHAAFHTHPGFEIRFLANVPPFTSVMIDGDISATTDSPDDQFGQIRVQPATRYQTQHKGLIVQFAKTEPGCLFDLFAADLREHWSRDGKPLPELFDSTPGPTGLPTDP